MHFLEKNISIKKTNKLEDFAVLVLSLPFQEVKVRFVKDTVCLILTYTAENLGVSLHEKLEYLCFLQSDNN